MSPEAAIVGRGAAAASAPQRATILVGYGAPGLDVLRRFLAITAPRGVLSGQEGPGGARPGARQLRDMALMWLRDPLGLPGQQPGNVTSGSSEMFEDLYRQIEAVDPNDPRRTLERRLVAAADHLLSAGQQASGSESRPLGLDVVVIARPTTPQVSRALDRLLQPAMQALLRAHPNLERPVDTASILNFIAIFDFDNYWEPSDVGRRGREAFYKSVLRWQRQEPTFSRFYLVDGQPRGGHREPSERVDEISLFLELLLFEGQRADALQRLYRPQPGESPVATFGVRQLERSSGLLRRLAAAAYAADGGTSDSDWLSYLAAADLPAAGAPGPGALRRNLRPYRRSELEAGLDLERLRQSLDERLETLEKRLIEELPFDHSDWPQRVRRLYDEVSVEARETLSEEVGRRVAEIRERPLAELPEHLERGIDADLHDLRDPLPLGRVIDQLEVLRDELAEAVPAVDPGDEARVETTFDELAALHRRYRGFRVDHVRVGGLGTWWGLYALIAAGALTPPFGRLLADIPQPASIWWRAGLGVADRLADPLLLAPMLLLVFWGFGLIVAQRRIALHFAGAERAYRDVGQGRFADRLRAALDRGGALRAPLESFLDRMARDLVVHVRSEVRRELDRILDLLRRRRREIRWLHRQLLEFRKMHGSGEPSGTLDSIFRQGSTVRHTMSQEADFQRLVDRQPASLEHFRATQARHQPFARWAAIHSSTFLDPLAFLDRLSEGYPDLFDQEMRDPGGGDEQRRRAAEIVSFLDNHGAFSLAFFWRVHDGVSEPQTFALLPAAWQRLDGVRPAIFDQGTTEERILTSDLGERAILLRVRLGVAVDALNRAGERGVA